MAGQATEENAGDLPLARHEEIRRLASTMETMRGTAKAARAAEAIAPAHPRQGTESPIENPAVGPLAAVAGRDAIGTARG